MTTREWLDVIRAAYVKARSRDEVQQNQRTVPELIDVLIAHLDRVGWPEAPHICGTCLYEKRTWPDHPCDPVLACDRLPDGHFRACEYLGHTCGAWTPKEPTP